MLHELVNRQTERQGGGGHMNRSLRVGPGHAYRTPSAAIGAASPGDLIEIEAAGDYTGDVCVVWQDSLTIRGVNGRPHIAAAGNSAEDKAIWVIKGNDTVVENVELSGAAVPDRNGAGIRQEGRNLTVRHGYLHNNENGILADDCFGSRILLEFTELAENGSGDGYSHNIYVNRVAELRMRYCYSHGTEEGHLVKSRAARTFLSYSRFSDGANGCAGYQIDLPNGGWAMLTGNVFQKGSRTRNPVIVSYCEERGGPAHAKLFFCATDNTFVNHRDNAIIFVAIRSKEATPSIIRRNILWGPGRSTTRPETISEDNWNTNEEIFRDAANFDFRLRNTRARSRASIDFVRSPIPPGGLELAAQRLKAQRGRGRR